MKLQNDTFLLRINTENAAFDEFPYVELARMLREIADKIEYQSRVDLHCFQNARDINGNTVGQYAIKPAGYEV